jgi:hypothetical protein
VALRHEGLPKSERINLRGSQIGKLGENTSDKTSIFNGHDWSGSCDESTMILIVTPNLGAGARAEALRRATGEEIVLAENMRQAATLLGAESYLAVVLDQYLLETEAEETEMVMRHLGTAIPLQVNMAISGVERLAREVRAAVQRRKREEVTARSAAVSSLRSELNDTVTALLLSCKLTLGVAGLPSAAIEKLQSAHELVNRLRSQLESTMLEA